MLDQASIPLRPGARTTDPETSHQADAETRKGKFNAQCREVFQIVKKHPGKSSKALAAIVYSEWIASGDMTSKPLDRYQIARRLSDLRELGKVENRYYAELGHPEFGQICKSPTGIMWWVKS